MIFFQLFLHLLSAIVKDFKRVDRSKMSATLHFCHPSFRPRDFAYGNFFFTSNLKYLFKLSGRSSYSINLSKICFGDSCIFRNPLIFPSLSPSYVLTSQPSSMKFYNAVTITLWNMYQRFFCLYNHKITGWTHNLHLFMNFPILIFPKFLETVEPKNKIRSFCYAAETLFVIHVTKKLLYEQCRKFLKLSKFWVFRAH